MAPRPSSIVQGQSEKQDSSEFQGQIRSIAKVKGGVMRDEDAEPGPKCVEKEEILEILELQNSRSLSEEQSLKRGNLVY